MLEFSRIPSMDRDSRSIHMQLAHNATTPFRGLDEFWSESTFLRTLPQTQKTNENVFLWVLIRQECLPTAISGVVPPK
jgi:hypothetical protein